MWWNQRRKETRSRTKTRSKYTSWTLDQGTPANPKGQGTPNWTQIQGTPAEHLKDKVHLT
ncbi:hypothetical protein HYE21_03870 [Mycoplasmopsis bovis]|nr:hypothetical protein [Mycoplasmopsis bovis]QQH24240.1 hypothetical protein HYE21_03870 [Mycoplasmopsis bovis]